MSTPEYHPSISFSWGNEWPFLKGRFYAWERGRESRNENMKDGTIHPYGPPIDHGRGRVLELKERLWNGGSRGLV